MSPAKTSQEGHPIDDDLELQALVDLLDNEEANKEAPSTQLLATVKKANSSLANVTQEEERPLDDDVDLHALVDLLDNTEANETVFSTKLSETPKEVNLYRNSVPRLREDSSFAEAFSYELDLPADALKAAEKAGKREELDSSDDEEVKNFLERKYNEYGNDINKKLKQQRELEHETKVALEVNSVLKAKSANKVEARVQETTSSIKNPHKQLQRKSLVASSSFQQPAKPHARNLSTAVTTAPALAVYTDPIFGLRMINPLVSSSLLTERMSGRRTVPFSGVAFHIEQGDLSKDWVIAGALVSKQVRSTKKGDAYSTWRLSDLRGDIKMISVFLFRGAHKELWKTAEGMCVAVLNASIFEKRAGSTDVACLSIDNAQKVMILGQSKDLGMCRAIKKNGDKCTAVVNVTECDYCIYHVKQEYGKMSRRSELQSATAGRGLNDLRNKVLGKNEVFYGGQSYSAVPARKSAKLANKDRERLSKLSEYAVSPFASSINHKSKPKALSQAAVPYAARGGPVSRLACNVEVLSKQRLKDMERIQQLKAENERFMSQNRTPSVESAQLDTSASASSKSSTTTQSAVAVPDKFKDRVFSASLSGTPKLSSENFCLEVNVGERRAQSAKQKAAQLLKKQPIEKSNPNGIRGTNQGKRRAIDELNEKFISNVAKRQKLEEEERETNRKSRIERIMAATSSHKNLVDLRDLEEQAQYFNKLEKKEAMEEKMLNTFKVPCKAVICQQCKYTAFSASDRCKEQKHTLKIVDAEKRFFQCQDCGNRTTTVFKLPKLSCKNCKGSRWQRTAMIRERKIVNCSEDLSIRGDEESFLGSLAAGGNLNLLMPDE